MSMLLRAFYGGTFDPVHNGHLAIARIAKDALGTTLWLLPAADPPHRAPPGASADHRAAMLALALDGQTGLRVDRRELDRRIAQPDTPSYTIDTVRELRAKYGNDAPLAFVVGADSFIGMPSWHAWPELLGAAHWVVAERPGSPLDEHLPPELARAAAGRWTLNAAALRDAPGGKVLRLRQPTTPESASQVRKRIADGQTWHHLVPPAVGRYIVEHGLYGAVAVQVPAAAPRYGV